MMVNSVKLPETWWILKNVVMISLAFMLHFTAYNGAANLQSSINAEDGLGTASLAAIYAGGIFSNLFLSAAVIKWLGTKWTMCLSIITYMPYIAAQFKPTFYTMIPAGLILGLGGGPLWCAKCTYLSVASKIHNKCSKISTDVLLTRFMGLFFMILGMNQVWGNLTSSLVLTLRDNTAAMTSLNASLISELCGANFLSTADAGEALPPQPTEKIQVIAGIYLACMAGAALVIAIGVDCMKRHEEQDSENSRQSGLALLAVTLKLQTDPNQLLLIIISIFIGAQQAYFSADVTAAYVSCAVGTGSVGFVMMTYGLAIVFFCVITGYIVKVTGRFPLICFATVLYTTLLITLLTWKPQAGSGYVLYIIAVFWGMCDSIWMVQMNAFFGIIFSGREEAAFSAFHLWESVGYIIAYVISPYLRTGSKTYLMIAMLALGVTGYCAVEYRVRRQQNEDQSKRVKDASDETCH